MTTDFVPGAVYTTRGNPAWWGAYASVAGQLIARGPRLALAAHSFLAVDTDTILDLGPGNPGRRPEVAVSSHPQDNGHWWRAWVPDASDRQRVVNVATNEYYVSGEPQVRHTARACIATALRRPHRVDERCCSTYLTELLSWAGVSLPGAPLIHHVLPSDIARVANVGTGITH